MSHRNARTLKSTGFTLVEILIVVVILGILAAIVIPQFTNASQAARASQLTAQLQTLRSQLELAQIEHQGVYPTLQGNTAATWAPLTTKTVRDASYTTAAANAVQFAGPYLQKPPVNAFLKDSTLNSSIGSEATQRLDLRRDRRQHPRQRRLARRGQGDEPWVWTSTTPPPIPVATCRPAADRHHRFGTRGPPAAGSLRPAPRGLFRVRLRVQEVPHARPPLHQRRPRPSSPCSSRRTSGCSSPAPPAPASLAKSTPRASATPPSGRSRSSRASRRRTRS